MSQRTKKSAISGDIVEALREKGFHFTQERAEALREFAEDLGLELVRDWPDIVEDQS